MSSKHVPPHLREEAEALLKHASAAEVLPRSAEELLHELQVHQIELEMQNQELRRAQIALEESRDRYVDLYEFAPIGYFTLTEKGLISEVNLRGADLLGMPREKLINRRFAGFVLPQDNARWHRYFLRLLQDGDKENFELALQCDGSPRFYGRVDCLRVVVEGKGAEIRIALTDITTRKQAEEALVKAGALQSAIFNSANFSSIATDARGVIQIFNVGAERMLGYKAAEVMNKITPADISDPQEVIARAETLSAELGTTITPGFEALVFKASRGIEDIYELTYIRKDGSRFPAVVSVTALRDAQDAIIGYLLIGTDNTARKQAEGAVRQAHADLEKRVIERTAELARSNESLRLEIVERKRAAAQLQLQATALNAAANAIIITDRDGTIGWANPAFCALTGYSDEEMIGRNPRLLNSGAQDAEFYRRMYQTILAGSVWRGEMVNRYKDGRLGAEDMTITPLRGDDGAITHFIAIKVDITERKRAEQEIRDLNASLERRVAERTAQLEEANRAKSDFLANMSHELRTPLNAIIGFSEMLKDGVLGELDKKQRGFVADIFGAGTHLLSLINDILDLSKVEAGKLQLEADAVNGPALLQASTMIVREKALAHRIRLDTRLDPALGSILADERKLKQIVYNLLSNAIKFTPEGGTVTLSAHRCARAEVGFDEAMPSRLLPLAPGEDGEFLAISVEDSGLGIAEEDLQKLYEPFSQVDSSASRSQAGTGLGLSLVRRLAELHGGTVGVASRPGAGSRFCVWLPYREVADAAQEDRAATKAVASTKPGPTVPFAHAGAAPTRPAPPLALVIEDDDQAADLIAARLHVEGFQVMRAATGEEGLVRAAERRPQLITLDIFLPAMDGWEFLRHLKADPRLADTPVVIISVSEGLDRGLALGARRVLQKPFTREELVTALAGLIETPRPEGTPARVLVVDDNVKTVERVATLIEREGYQALRAYGGAEAIETVRRDRPDLVILDLMMPEVSSFEVARALRASENTARIPILVLAAKNLTPEERAQLNSAVNAILQKSEFSHDELLAELRRAIALRKPDQAIS